MPLYPFQHPKTGKIKDVFVSLKEPDDKRRFHLDDKGVKWKRVLEAPMIAVDTKINPYSEKEFREKTYAKKGETLGSMFDRSKELSDQRASKNQGVDPVQEKYFKDYRKRKRGTPHTAELKRNQGKAKEHLDKGLKALGVSISAKFSNT